MTEGHTRSAAYLWICWLHSAGDAVPHGQSRPSLPSPVFMSSSNVTEKQNDQKTTKKKKNSIHWVNSMRMRKSAHKCTVWHTFSWKIQFTPSRSSVMKGDELCWAPTPWPGIMLPQAVVGAPLGNPWIWWMGARISTNKTLTAAAQVNAAFWLYDMLKTECAADFLLYNIGQQLLYSWAAALRCAVLVYSLVWCVVYTPRARTEERETPHDLGWLFSD